MKLSNPFKSINKNGLMEKFEKQKKAMQESPTLLHEELSKYTSYYSDSHLLEKIKKFAVQAGIKTVYKALLLYQTLLSGEVSITNKAIIMGALGYFIYPVDLVPDLLAGLGYMDDSSMLLLALRTVESSITPAIEAAARQQLQNWFKLEEVQCQQLLSE